MRFLSINRLAYLSMIRNVRRGLETRSHIIEHIKSDTWTTSTEISKHVTVTTATVLYHLRNLERERIVERNPEGYGWRFGPFEQSDLTQFLETKAKRKTKR